MGACQNESMRPVFRSPFITRSLLLLILLAGVYFFRGFLVPVLAALIIGFASWPLYRKVVARCHGNTTLAASLAILVVLLVLVVALLIAAVEATVDRVSLERHELAKRAKDVGSAAVLVALLNAAVVWSLLLF